MSETKAQVVLVGGHVFPNMTRDSGPADAPVFPLVQLVVLAFRLAASSGIAASSSNKQILKRLEGFSNPLKCQSSIP